MALVQSNFNQHFNRQEENKAISFMNNMYKHTAGGLAVSGIIACLFNWTLYCFTYGITYGCLSCYSV